MNPTGSKVTRVFPSMTTGAFRRPPIARLAILAALMGLALAALTPRAHASSLFERFRLGAARRNIFAKAALPPQVRITSPLNGAFIAPGDSRVGSGDPDGAGFAIV